VKTTANKITREARIVVALLIASVFVLAWWITEAGKLGDTYGQLVLVGALVFISAIGSYIVTSELRDIQSRKTRKMLNKFHTQQVNELSDAIAKLETQLHNKNSALDTVTRGAYHMAWALCEDYDLRDSCLHTLHDINKLEVSDEAKYLKFAETEIEFYAEIDQDGRDVAPVVTDYTYSASTALLLGTLDKAYSLANGETRYPLA
jgi:hypothetical protein